MVDPCGGWGRVYLGVSRQFVVKQFSRKLPKGMEPYAWSVNFAAVPCGHAVQAKAASLPFLPLPLSPPPPCGLPHSQVEHASGSDVCGVAVGAATVATIGVMHVGHWLVGGLLKVWVQVAAGEEGVVQPGGEGVQAGERAAESSEAGQGIEGERERWRHAKDGVLCKGSPSPPPRDNSASLLATPQSSTITNNKSAALPSHHPPPL
jgi:hypothetical protein